MLIYLEFIKNAFQARLAYRVNVLLHLLGRVIALFIQISIWRALLANSPGFAVGNSVVTFRDMVTYVVISTGISVFIDSDVIWMIERKIQTGEVAMDLIKPVNFKGYLFAETIGANGFRIIFELLPLIVVSIIFFGMKATSLQNLIFFLITLGNGLVIYFLMNYLVGLLAFWYYRVQHFRQMLVHIIKLLSGSLVPLWFFPGVFQKIAEVLPFKLIFFTPIAVYLGKLSGRAIVLVIAEQIIWLVLLYVVGVYVWQRAVGKVVVQGG